jgi:hypothetical protein
MPLIELGAEAQSNCALNCCPWVRSLTKSQDAVIHSPAEIVAAWPTTVARSRCLGLYTQHTKAGVRIVEADPLNDAGEHFAIGLI